uniref:Protein yippee-like n=1 Tax=Panagrolaimus davidi TaxID=227884 RepID=A0A914P9R7_9BILA
MGRPFLDYLDDSGEIYECRRCSACLTSIKLLVSKAFRGATGTAYLFKHVINVYLDKQDVRDMTTGRHMVRDVYCTNCNEKVGWFYDMAYKKDQEYKEGNYILEKALIKERKSFSDGAALRLSTSSSSSTDNDKDDITV